MSFLSLAACGTVPVEAPPPEPEPVAAPEGCEPLFADLPALVVPRPTPLEQAATWSHRVDARGAYGHQVAFDPQGRAVWTQDSANMRFTLRTVAPDGEVLRVQVLDPPKMAPEVLATGPDGTVVAGGTVFGMEGPALTAIGPDGAVRWHQGTPRVGVSHVVPLPGGAWGILGTTSREEVTLGDTTMRRTPGWLGISMDVLAVLDAEGQYQWSRAFHSGALDLAVQDGDLFLAGHFGREGWVDYGGGPVVGAGVLARIGADGAHVWSRAFDDGLFDVVPWRDDAVLVSSRGWLRDGGELFLRTRLLAVGLDGCDRGSVDLGNLPRLRLGLDGSLLAYGLALDGEPPRLGTTPLDVPRQHWWIARFTPDLEVAWVHTAACDSVEVAGGPRGEAAVSCFRDLSDTLRRTELSWIPARDPR
jgi:hypothetical protein